MVDIETGTLKDRVFSMACQSKKFKRVHRRMVADALDHPGDIAWDGRYRNRTDPENEQEL